MIVINVGSFGGSDAIIALQVVGWFLLPSGAKRVVAALHLGPVGKSPRGLFYFFFKTRV